MVLRFGPCFVWSVSVSHFGQICCFAFLQSCNCANVDFSGFDHACFSVGPSEGLPLCDCHDAPTCFLSLGLVGLVVWRFGRGFVLPSGGARCWVLALRIWDLFYVLLVFGLVLSRFVT